LFFQLSGPRPVSSTLGFLSVEIKIHPTHARNTKNIMVGLGVVAISGWVIVMEIGQHNQNPEIVNIIVLIGVISGFGIFIVDSLRAFLLKCPSCKKLLTKQVSVNVSTETRKFCCKRCNVIWDSKVKYEFGGD
jgi:hypothetical protein